MIKINGQKFAYSESCTILMTSALNADLNLLVKCAHNISDEGNRKRRLENGLINIDPIYVKQEFGVHERSISSQLMPNYVAADDITWWMILALHITHTVHIDVCIGVCSVNQFKNAH